MLDQAKFMRLSGNAKDALVVLDEVRDILDEIDSPHVSFSIDLYYETGLSQFQTGNIPEARAYYQKALQLTQSIEAGQWVAIDSCAAKMFRMTACGRSGWTRRRRSPAVTHRSRKSFSALFVQ
jgi:hypothetical protein